MPGPIEAEKNGIEAHANRIVRVFISSTFRDFNDERDILAKFVFPELRRRARDRCVEVIGVDLRWGITEEAAQRGETLPICLREIDRSRPFFVGLLGERYGWTPPREQISEQLVSDQPWLAEHIGGMSVTELEIQYGVLNNPAMRGRALFFFRDPGWSAKAGTDFQSGNPIEHQKLTDLKRRVRDAPFPVVDYPSPDQFGKLVLERLWELIDVEYPIEGVPNSAERERRIHASFAAERTRFYLPNQASLDRVVKFLDGGVFDRGSASPAGGLLLISGDSGSGKSSLLANATVQLKRRDLKPTIVEHYCGAGANAADGSCLMRRLASELLHVMGDSVELDQQSEVSTLTLGELWRRASDWAEARNTRIAVVVDALDRLPPHERWQWLPTEIVPCLSIAISALPGEISDEAMARGAAVESVCPLDTEDVRQFIRELLASRGRVLPVGDLERIAAHSMATLPIFLKVLIAELLVFGSHARLADRITECLQSTTPEALIELVIARIEADVGKDAVRSVLSAIWASAGGMSEDEILQYGGLTMLQWSVIRFALDDALFESDGGIAFAHRYLEIAVERRFIDGRENLRALHLSLLRFFGSQPDSARVARCRVHHATQIEVLESIDQAILEIERRREELRKERMIRYDCHFVALHRRKSSLENMLRRRPLWHPGVAVDDGMGGADTDYLTHWKWDCCGMRDSTDASPPSRFTTSGCSDVPVSRRTFAVLRLPHGMIPYWDAEDFSSVVELECCPQFGCASPREHSAFRLRQLRGFMQVAPLLHHIVKNMFWRELESLLSAHAERLSEAGHFDEAAEHALEALEVRLMKFVNAPYWSGGIEVFPRTDESACRCLVSANRHLLRNEISRRQRETRQSPPELIRRFSFLANEIRNDTIPSSSMRTAVAEFLATWALACESAGQLSQRDVFAAAATSLGGKELDT